jgi:hypothetical protein
MILCHHVPTCANGTRWPDKFCATCQHTLGCWHGTESWLAHPQPTTLAMNKRPTASAFGNSKRPRSTRTRPARQKLDLLTAAILRVGREVKRIPDGAGGFFHVCAITPPGVASPFRQEN